jgi:hypothetical protein
MKFIFFGDCVPREVHKQLFDSFPGRVFERVGNEYLLTYLESFVGLGFEVYSIVSDFARPVIKAEFGSLQGSQGVSNAQAILRDPKSGINYQFINNDGPKIMRLLKRMQGYSRILRQFKRDLRTAGSSERLLIGNYSGQIMYAWSCLRFRRSNFGKRFVRYLAIMADRPVQHSQSLLLNFLGKIQWRWLRDADAIIVHSELEAREMYRPRVGNRVFTIPVIFASSVISQYEQVQDSRVARSDSKAKGDDNFEFSVVYTGFIRAGYAIDSLIETIKLAQILYPRKFRWRFAGWGTDFKQELEELAGLRNSGVELLGVLDAEDLVRLQKSADVLISLRRNYTSQEKLHNRYGYAAKLFDYLLAERPAVTNDFPAIEDGMRPFLNIVDSLEPEAILAIIERIRINPPSPELLEKGREYVINHHSPATLTRKLREVLDNIGVKV